MSEVEAKPPWRPTKLTLDVFDGVVALVRGGITPDIAFAKFGISERSIERWEYNARKEPGSTYGDLWREIRRAKAEYACEVLQEWHALGLKDFEERKALLFIMFPELTPQAAGLRLRVVEQMMSKTLRRLAKLESERKRGRATG